MAAKTYIDAFNPEEKDLSICEKCGLCLQRCPVMKMEKEASRAEMGRLLKGHETERVLNGCRFCFNGNPFLSQYSDQLTVLWCIEFKPITVDIGYV